MPQPALEVFGQREGRGVATRRIFLEALQADRGEVAVDLWIEQPRISRFGAKHHPHSFKRAAANKWRATGEKLIQNRAHSIDIGRAGRGRAFRAARLFRRDVTRRAHELRRARHRALGFDQPGQAEIGQMRLAFMVEQDVSRLDVAMEDAALMRVVHAARHFRA